MAYRGEIISPKGIKPQELSTGVVTPELKITSIETLDRFMGIPLKGLDSVESALRLFATGRTVSGRATRNDLEENILDAGGAMGLGVYLMSPLGKDSPDFVTKMLEEAREEIRESGKWRRNYDYDGQGVFHKTAVEIDKIPDKEDIYLLKLWAAYVGGEVEDGLAESLGIEQGLQFKHISASLESQGDKFAIDFDAVAKKLQPLYVDFYPKGAPLTGDSLLDVMLAVDSRDKNTRSFPIGARNGIDVSFDLGRLGHRIKWKNGEPSEDTWSREGNVLMGPLVEDRSEEGKFESPSIIVSINRHSQDRWDRLPAIDPEMKAEMNEIGSKAVAALS